MYIAKNVVEDLVWEKLFEIIAVNPLKCNCSKCVVDIVAYALNELKPHYVTTMRGEAIVKTNALNAQVLADVVKVLSRGIMLVGENPKHSDVDLVKR
ncbi:MAG: late competence development ComFB family protein [Firmicutes bacterium]|nr:late competence development ComFB family protein [Bacillota bacterium]